MKGFSYSVFKMSTTEMMLQVFTLALSLALTCANFPSSRIVYYIHSTPASWLSARDTCERYGGMLVNVKDWDNLEADVDTLDTVLDWNGEFARLSATSNLWSGLHKFADPSGAGKDILMWHKCEAYTSASAPNDNIGTTLLGSPDYCASIDANLQLEATSCDTELPYICQILDGQCWFLPVEDQSFIGAADLTSTADLNTCAQMCRNNITQAGMECWGFVAEGGECKLYRDDNRHAFIRNPGSYLHEDVGVTAYLKICTGGEPTKMEPVTDDPSLQPPGENCTAVSTVADWDDGVCYCDCDQPPVILDPEYLALPIDEKVDKIVKELYVDPKDTSSSYRKLNSAEDDRPSAQSIGAMGIAILSVVFGGIILLDLDVLISHIGRIFGKNEDSTKRE